MLHIASHGFFLEDGAREGASAPTTAGARASDSATIENPLLRSGIALAGANLGDELAETAFSRRWKRRG